MINNFHKTKLTFKTLELIATERDSLKRDLVAYSNDPVRYHRRFRMLLNLAEYELSILTKIRNFETSNETDLGELTGTIANEIRSIVNRDA